MRGGLRSPLKPAGKGLGPLRWTVTTPIAQIDHSDQNMLRRGSRGQYFGACPLDLVKGCPKVPRTTGINQRAGSNTEGLGPLRWIVTTTYTIAQIDHSDQICCAANQSPATCGPYARWIPSTCVLRSRVSDRLAGSTVESDGAPQMDSADSCCFEAF
jgi:hypothetical protein